MKGKALVVLMLAAIMGMVAILAFAHFATLTLSNH